MIALLALISFVVGLVKLGTFDSWEAWLLLGLALLAADSVFIGFGYSYPSLRGRRNP